MNKPALLISACLLGQPVRYDGQGKGLPAEQLAALHRHYRLISICPECQGGLPTPRPAAEIHGGDGHTVLSGNARVITAAGDDQSHAFVSGAHQALACARQHGAGKALLKAYSPSCGNEQIYSGHFDGRLQPGSGVTACLLRQHGIQIFNEQQIAQLLQD